MVSKRSARRAAARVGRLVVAGLAAGWLGAATLSAQADSVQRDSTKLTRLSPLSVTVTRTVEARTRVPASVGVVDTAALWRAQLLGGIDEALGRIPGVVALNRYNPSLDERLIIRGSGARGNFGVRGIKILIDGLPQTLPDGQSQLNNLDLGTIGRVEALLGSSSALYGNAAAGVLSFSTVDPTPEWSGRLRVTGGSFGTSRVSGMTTGTMGDWRGFIAATQLRSDGFRQHSQGIARQVSVGLDRILSPNWLLKIRYFLASDPTAQNPGALTAAELAANPDSAAAANVLRGANKVITQHQAGITLARADANGNRFEATVFGLTRSLDNPLATAPPGAPGPTVGTFSSIDRRVGGARMFGSWRIDPRARLSLGGDAQIMRDDRLNRRSAGGTASDNVTANQRETVSELAPFAALHWEPARAITVTSALRYDRIRFRVQDHYLGDGIDQSGVKNLGSVSGSVGSSVAAADRLVLYGNVASAFETPTTTELVNQSNGQIGFNTDLGPQRTLTVEIGGRTTGPVEASLALYRARVTDPLVQVKEQDGRAFFANAGRIRVQGIEAGLRARPAGWLRLEGSYAYTDATYQDYQVQNGPTVDDFAGHRVPGVPDHVVRAIVGLTGKAVSLEVEQQIVSSLFADDKNAIEVKGWGAGVTGVRVAGSFALGRIRIGPFGAVQNLFDRRYVATVTVNGFGGRVFEPAPGRWAWIGAELAW